MNKKTRPFLSIEIIKNAKGGNKLLCSFLDDSFNEITEEIQSGTEISGNIPASQNIRSITEATCILPADFISFKILTFPFRLKSAKQINSLIGPAIEEQNPLPLGDLGIAFTRLGDNSVLVEYARKDKLNKITAEIDSLISRIFKNNGGKVRIKLLSPYSLLYKIATGSGGVLNPSSGTPEDTGDIAAVYRFHGNNFGILVEKGILKDILNLNIPFNEERLKAAEQSGINVIYPGKDLKSYLNGNNAIKRKDMPGFFGTGPSVPVKGISGYIVKNYRIIFAFSVIFFILTALGTAWQIESMSLKSKERTVLREKMDSILGKYLPGQKFFFEPRFDIKNYYDSLKTNSSSESAGKHFLDMFKYVSAFKPSVNNLKITKIGYSLGRFDITGTVEDYNSLNKLEKYLEGKYSSVNVVNSEKTESAVSFTVYLSS